MKVLSSQRFLRAFVLIFKAKRSKRSVLCELWNVLISGNDKAGKKVNKVESRRKKNGFYFQILL
jgi:hypothetical protein